MPFTALRSRISPSCGASQGIESEISRVRSSSLMAGSGVDRFSSRRRAPFSAWPVVPALMRGEIFGGRAGKRGAVHVHQRLPLVNVLRRS